MHAPDPPHTMSILAEVSCLAARARVAPQTGALRTAARAPAAAADRASTCAAPMAVAALG